MAGRYVVEHQRVPGGDWVGVQTIDDDVLEWCEAVIADYNADPAFGAWRIRERAASPRPAPALPTVTPERVSWWQRLRFRLVLLFSKRAR